MNSNNKKHQKLVKPLQIVFFATQLYALARGRETGYGGAETEMWNIARGLADDLHFDVRVLTLTNETDVPEKYNGLTLHPVPPPKPLTYNDSWFTRRRAVLRYYYKLFKVLREQKADIYYSKLASAEACIVWLASRAAGARYIFRVEHDWETNFSDLTRNIFRGKRSFAWGFVYCLRRANIVIAQTSAQVAALKSNFGINAVIIPNGHEIPPETSVEHNPDRRTTILWVGRAHPMKRPGLFIDLAEHFPDFHFVMIVAPGTEHTDLFSTTRERALKLTNVEFIPGVAAQKLGSFYQNARLFILTSEAEGFSNVIIEAMKNGCPVLTLEHNPDNIFATLTDTDQPMPAPGYCTMGSIRIAQSLVERMFRDLDFWIRCHNTLGVMVQNNFGLEHVLSVYKKHFLNLGGTK